MTESAKAGKPWVVANDEQNPADTGRAAGSRLRRATAARPARTASAVQMLHDIRKATLWGTLMAGGAGVEYYFGYKLPQNDLDLRGLAQPRQVAGTTAASRWSSSATTRFRSGR